MPPQSRYGSLPFPDGIAATHGTFVLADAGGDMLGVCKMCDLVYSGHSIMEDPTPCATGGWKTF